MGEFNWCNIGLVQYWHGFGFTAQQNKNLLAFCADSLLAFIQRPPPPFHSHLSAVSSCAGVRNGLFQVYGLIRGSSCKKKKWWQFCSEVSVSVRHWSVFHTAFRMDVWPWSVFHTVFKVAVWPVSVLHCSQNGSLTLISVSHCSEWQSDLDQCFTLH